MIVLLQTEKDSNATVAMLRNNKTVKVTQSSLIRLLCLWSKPNYFIVKQYKNKDRLITCLEKRV